MEWIWEATQGTVYIHSQIRKDSLDTKEKVERKEERDIQALGKVAKEKGSTDRQKDSERVREKHQWDRTPQPHTTTIAKTAIEWDIRLHSAQTWGKDSQNLVTNVESLDTPKVYAQGKDTKKAEKEEKANLATSTGER